MHSRMKIHEITSDWQRSPVIQHKSLLDIYMTIVYKETLQFILDWLYRRLWAVVCLKEADPYWSYLCCIMLQERKRLQQKVGTSSRPGSVQSWAFVHSHLRGSGSLKILRTGRAHKEPWIPTYSSTGRPCILFIQKYKRWCNRIEQSLNEHLEDKKDLPKASDRSKDATENMLRPDTRKKDGHESILTPLMQGPVPEPIKIKAPISRLQ